LKSLAQSLFMGVMNPDEIKLQLHSRKVMDYVEETRIIHSESENWGEGVGEFNGQTGTESEGGSPHGAESSQVVDAPAIAGIRVIKLQRPSLRCLSACNPCI